MKRYSLNSWQIKQIQRTFSKFYKLTPKFHLTSLDYSFNLRRSLLKGLIRWIMMRWHVALVASRYLDLGHHFYSNILNRIWLKMFKNLTLKILKSYAGHSFSPREGLKESFKFWCQESNKYSILLPLENCFIWCMATMK